MPGNPNPSPATRFKPGDEWAGNGKGKTKEQRAAEIRAAENAALLRDLALSEMLERVQRGEMTPMEAITADNLRLFKDSEDRAHGTPRQAVELTGADKGPMQVIDPSKVSIEALREIMAATREAPEPDAS